MRASAAVLACSLASSAYCFDFTVSSLDTAPAAMGDPVLHLQPDGLPCIAYYSAEAGGIVFGQPTGGSFQFEIVQLTSAPSEVALAIGPNGERYLAFADETLRIAHQEAGAWTIQDLGVQVGTPTLDLEFGPNGVLGLAYSLGASVRYVELLVGTRSIDTVVNLNAESLDLEYDIVGGTHIAFWSSVPGSPSDQLWGAVQYLRRDGSATTFRSENVGSWMRSPALEIHQSGNVFISACRFEQGQELWTRTAVNPAYPQWIRMALEAGEHVELERTGSAFVGTASGGLHLLARSRLQRMGTDGKVNAIAQVAAAESIGREAMAIAPSGRIFLVYRVGTALYYSTFHPDEAPAPVFTHFEGPSAVLQHRPATFTWETEHAGVVVADGRRAAPNGSRTIIVEGTGTYVFRAYGFGGSTELQHPITALPAPPIIREWSVEPDHQIVASDEVRFKRDCLYADRIRIDPLGIESTVLESYTVTRVYATTTFVLTAYNENGSVSDSITVDVKPFEIRGFSASEGIIGAADAVELRWEVYGTANVSIDDVGTVPALGSAFVTPGQSRDYTLTAEWDGYVETATLHVEVDDSFLESRFFLSYAPDEVQPDPPSLSTYQVFTVHLLGLSLDGHHIAGVEFGLDYPPGLHLMATDLHSHRAINVVQPPDFIVGLGQCFELTDLYLLATFTFMPSNQATIDEGSVRLRPAIIPSIPGRVAYATCVPDLNGSELNGPVLSAIQGPPLYLSANRVPAVALALRAERAGGNVRLSWNALALGPSDRFELASSPNGASWRVESSWSWDASAPTAWEGPAPAQKTIYRLRLFRDQELWLEATSELSPDLPSRTRLVSASPNPFNPKSTIRFDAAVGGHYELTILNTAGRLVRTLGLDTPSAGSYAQDWDGRDESGRFAASGVYFLQLRGGGAIDRMRLVLLK